MNRDNSAFRGTGVAIVTPFDGSGNIDFGSYEKILDFVIGGGIDYIVALGTTGEAPTLSRKEKETFVEFSAEKIAGRVPLVVGIGGNNTAEVVASVKSMPLKRVDGILSVCPYYNKPQQEGIYRHFKAVAEASELPVILYTVPGRTGSNINAFTTIKLAREFPNIIGIKEASGNLDQIYNVLLHRPDDFLVISGDDGLTLPLLAAGADGVISVVANAYPKEFSSLVNSGLDEDFFRARKIHFQLIDMINEIFADGSPAGIKALLEIMGLCNNELRLPLVPVGTATFNRIKELVKQIEVAP